MVHRPWACVSSIDYRDLRLSTTTRQVVRQSASHFGMTGHSKKRFEIRTSFFFLFFRRLASNLCPTDPYLFEAVGAFTR